MLEQFSYYIKHVWTDCVCLPELRMIGVRKHLASYSIVTCAEVPAQHNGRQTQMHTSDDNAHSRAY